VKTSRSHFLVFVMVPNRRVARKLARVALEERAVACANVIPGVESHYWWQGKIEAAPELLVIFKTAQRQLDVLEQVILKNHPYDTPEILVFPILSGNERYLQWIDASVGGTGR
jgi:periplasmic divalent cation tolerance protein